MSPVSPPEPDSAPVLDYQVAEGFHDHSPPPPAPAPVAPDGRSEWLFVGIGLTALIAVIASVLALVGLA
jgi:hypothetical protein